MATLLVTVDSPAGADPVTPGGSSATQQADPLAAFDERSAALLAYRKRRPVIVTSLTSETSQTVARPDGTFETTRHMAPVRMRNDSGSWVDVDLTLQRRPDGTVAPRAHPRRLSLAGAGAAGEDALVGLGEGSERTTLGWSGALPEPVLDGRKATYVDVKPGVDLVVEARPTGFEYFLVVKHRQAAAQVASVAMPWDTGELAVAPRPAGGLELRSESGVVVDVPPAEMWDAQRSPSGEPVRRAPVALSTTGAGESTELVVTPDAAFLADPGVVYPVTIDPSINLEPAFDAYVQDTIVNTDKSGDTQLRLGYSDDPNEGCASGCTARSFLAFGGLGGYAGASVISAELFLWNFHSWSCTSAEWQTWRTTSVSSSTRWGSQPSWAALAGSSTGTKGYNSGCGDGWVSASVKDVFQYVFNNSGSTATVGIRATSETNHNGWKKFDSSEGAHSPYVQLVYNRKPRVPTGLAVNSCYSACASPAVVRSGAPQLAAVVSDPDGGTLRAEYEVWDNAKTTRKAASGTAVTGVASGTSRPWRVTPTLPDGTYHWRVRACDSYPPCGDFSGWFTFTVNTQDPSLPTVSGTPYTEKQTGTWNGGPGQAGSFTFGPNGAADVQEYVYSLNGANAVTVPSGTPQAEKLTVNQQQVATDETGFTAGANATIWRSPNLGHGGNGALKVSVTATAANSYGPQGDTYATVGGDNGGLRLGMQAGKRYLITGWIWVPAATGLNPGGTYGTSRGQRIVAFYNSGSAHIEVPSGKATATDAWNFVSLAVTIPSNATEAFVRLYNGSPTGPDKPVYWDHLSLRELTGTTTVTSITPSKDGLNVLSVQSRNTAGFTSDPRVYQFLVSPSTATWHWPLDEGTGTSAASVPDTRPVTFTEVGVSWTGGRVGAGAVTIGSGGRLTTAGSPVLDTTDPAGYTVAAWVRATDLASTRTAVSQDGIYTSMFRLGFRNDRDLDGDAVPDPAWCFSLTRADSSTAVVDAACTTDYVAPDDWVSLVGVYDPINGKIKLYVNGTPAVDGSYAEAAYTGAWSATASFAMGRAWPPAEFWSGDIDHVYAAQQVWDDNEIQQFALQ
ncbi:LamG-like jellyroll fold domain-containing protein [Phytohabitans sp. ZYX-F-186]|uniref:LamG-like jellyroll fold domain-containing protein n=1 Tax=Phytohabitans maris TaxID=3071409 RepID=A0ABU0ZX79_9ACTN|nr:LamG-like jellyroll fold domain-containing protein [Phytohabitans sp. ZYX-F-186]MDQ7911102.1 LamG-like jellyroll fold domain-containing protein [Phytohabitans sp. ZYX-F-186]